MSLYKVEELEGALLDAAVAQCEGHEWDLNGADKCVLLKGANGVVFSARRGGGLFYAPSTDWTYGGPIIERFALQIAKDRADDWSSRMSWEDYYHPGMGGPTPLIAAMRCYVRSKFGDTVELP